MKGSLELHVMEAKASPSFKQCHLKDTDICISVPINTEMTFKRKL